MTWHCLLTLTWVCLTLSFSFHLIMKLFLHILIYLWKFILMFMLLWFFWYIFYWLFRKYVGNVCIHMHVCMYLFCMYATHVCVHICIHANMYGCVHVCIYGRVFACVCRCVHFMCMYMCALCAYSSACMFRFPYKSFFWMHLYPLSSVGSLEFPKSRHFVFSSVFISHLFLLSYCII